MEPLSAAASIIALIQVAGKLAFLGGKYIQGVKHASKDIDELIRELNSFKQVLVALKEHAEKVSQKSVVLQGLNGQIQECTQQLESLGTELERGMSTQKGLQKIFRSLKWPFKGPETAQIIERIERHKSSFTVALSADNLSLSQSTEIHVKSVETHVKSVETRINSVNLHVRGLEEHARAESVARSFREDKEETAFTKKKRKKVLNWLYPENFDTKHTEISNRRQKDTGKWLLESKEMQNLANGTGVSKLLWGYGIPGAGKTFLSSGVIDHFQTQAQEANYGVAYVYFDYKEKNQQTPLRVLASLVKQLALPLRHLPAEIEKMYDKLEHQGKQPSLEELLTTLIAVSNSFDRVFLIFDALDECSQKSQRKELLPLFHRMGEGGANLFITSRHYPEDIKRSFCDVAQIELSATRQDIRSYVKEKIRENPRAGGLIQQGGCELEERIVSELISCAQGMFLLVHFHIEHLCAQTTAKQILATLDTIKTSSTGEHPLDPTYDRVMESISQQPKPCAELAMNILSWLVMSHRILTVQEIQIAVSIELEKYALDELDLPHKATLLEVCAGLVTIDEGSDTIRLAHLTVQEYLLRTTISSKDVHNKLATACMSFLSFDIFSGDSCKTGDALDARLESHPFLEYAVRHMPTHLKRCDETVSKDLIFRFIGRPSNASAWIQASMHLGSDKNLSNQYLATAAIDPTPLHIVSYIGNHSVVQQLLEEGANISACTRNGETVMHWAAQSGDVALIRLLVEHRVDILTQDNSEETPLHQAAQRGREEVVQFLLENGGSASAPNNGGSTPVHLAAYNGHEAVVRLLLENGGSASTPDNDGDTPLHIAAMNGHEPTVRVLLERGVEVSVVNKPGYTPLYWAVFKGHIKAVKLLLGNGADTSIPDNEGRTPLYVSAQHGRDEIMRVLLENGADASTPDNDGDTPLHIAAMEGHESTARVLLESGVEVSVMNKLGYTPLYWAACKGHDLVVQFLLDNGADPSTPDNQGRTALKRATDNGHEAVVKLLEKSNATSAPETIAATETAA